MHLLPVLISDLDNSLYLMELTICVALVLIHHAIIVIYQRSLGIKCLTALGKEGSPSLRRKESHLERCPSSRRESPGIQSSCNVGENSN